MARLKALAVNLVIPFEYLGFESAWWGDFMYRNSNAVFTQKMLPIGKTPIYNSILNEYESNDTSSKLVMKYATNPTSRQEIIARSCQLKSDNAVSELANKKRLTKREKAILKMMTGRK